MFFKRKKKVEKANLNSAGVNDSKSLNSNFPAPPKVKDMLPQNSEQNPQTQNLFSGEVIPPIRGLDISKNSASQAENLNENDLREKSKLFEPFRQEAVQSSSSSQSDELKKTIINNEKEIGKIASSISEAVEPKNKTYEDNNYSLGSSKISDEDFALSDDYLSDDSNIEDESPVEEEVKDKFVSISAYKQAVKELNFIRKMLSESNNLLDEVKSNMQEESKNFSDLKAKLEDVERKIINLDQSLFGED